MKKFIGRVAIALCGLAFLLCLSPSYAFAQSSFTAKDSTGTALSFCEYPLSGVLHPCHVLEGIVSGTSTPKAWSMDSNGNGNVNVVGAAALSLANLASYSKPVTSFASITVGTAFTPGLGIAAVCTAAGNIVLAGADATSITVPVGVGFNQFGFSIAKVVSQTATCTFTALN